MKNIKTFDSFVNERFTENFPVRKFSQFTLPKEPFGRELTKEESDFMIKNFSNFSFTNHIDADGNILLGNGIDEEAIYYITEDDLMKYMNKTNEGLKEEKFPKKDLGHFESPEEPMKRELTLAEKRFMHNSFPLHSYSDVDAKGRIILGGGESSKGRYYITEEDLEKYMKVYKNSSYLHNTKSPYK